MISTGVSTKELYRTYRESMRKIADIRFANAVLQWDQETFLPSNGAEFRGQQIATLSELSHQFFSEEKLGDTLNELAQRNDLDNRQKRNVELSLQDYNKNKKYTSAFVRALSEQVNKAFHSWIEARKQNSFRITCKYDRLSAGPGSSTSGPPEAVKIILCGS